MDFSVHADSLGIVEAKSIAAGVRILDAMVKAADVELVKASTICSGRYLVFVSGDVEAVETSVATAEESGAGLVGSYTLSNISKQVLKTLKQYQKSEPGQAIGVVESKTVSSGIAAADKAVKRSLVTLNKLVTGQGINGKAYFVMTGDVASVNEAVEAAMEVLGKYLVDVTVLPSPDRSVARSLTGIL